MSYRVLPGRIATFERLPSTQRAPGRARSINLRMGAFPLQLAVSEVESPGLAPVRFWCQWAIRCRSPIAWVVVRP